MGLFLACCWMLGCKESLDGPAVPSWTFKPPVVRDTSTANRIDCLKDSVVHSAWYTVGYAGPVADTVAFDGSVQFSEQKSETPYDEPIQEAPDSAIHVAIDTSQRVAIEQLVFRMGERPTRDAFVGYPVFVVNRSSDTVSVGLGAQVALILQGQGPEGKWQPLERRYIYDCGFGLQSQLIPPQNMVVTAIPICKNGVPTQLRICYGNSCSETFVGFVEPAIFKSIEVHPQ